MRLVEQLSGVGAVLRADGSVLGQHRYRLNVWQEMHNAGGQQIEGLRSIDGVVKFDGAVGIDLIGEDLTLVLEDGRRLPFLLEDTDGRIAPSGSLA
jgi:hypothetical protein